MNNRFFASGAFMLGLACAHLSVARTDEPAPGVADPVPTAADLRGFIANFDSSLDVLRQISTLPPSVAGLFPEPDFRHRRLSDDWRDHVLPPADILSLSTQRDRIVQAIDRSDWVAAAADLAAMQAYGRAQALEVRALMHYWQKVGAHPPNWQPYLDMLRANGIDPSFTQNFTSLERTFALQLSIGLFETAMTVTWPKLLDIHERGARLDSKALEALIVPDKGLYPRSGAGDCSPPAASTSGKATVKLDPSRPVAPVIYPDGPDRRHEEGRAVVGLMVSPLGCVQVAAVFGSSGYEELDKAAVAQGLAVRFLPAEHDGVAIEHMTLIPVDFKIANQR